MSKMSTHCGTHRKRKEGIVLKEYRDRTPQIIKSDLFNIHTINKYLALRGVMDSSNELQNDALSGTIDSYQYLENDQYGSNDFAQIRAYTELSSFYLERYVSQRVLICVLIPK